MQKTLCTVISTTLLGCFLLVVRPAASEEIFSCGNTMPRTPVALTDYEIELGLFPVEEDVNISIEKLNHCEEQSANVKPTWVVSNTGKVPLSNIQVTDEVLGEIPCQQKKLAVGESMTCQANKELSQFSAEQHSTRGCCAVGEHIVVQDVGVLVTTKGDCDRGA
jgi:hypothetical protein